MNKVLFRLHSWMALIAFAPLLVICVTGSLLVFKHEIDTLLMADTVRVEVGGRERLPLDRLLNEVNGDHPGHEVVGWVLFQDPGRADLVYLMEKGSSDWSYVLLDQYRGEMLAPVRGTSHYLTDWLLSLHYTFLLDDAGLPVTSVFSIVLCLLGISGLILHRKFWKNFFTLRWKSRIIVYFSDLHKITGVVASPILLILGFTGAWWNIDHFIHEVEEHRGGVEHYRMAERLYSSAISLQALHDDSQKRIAGFTPTYITMPWEPGVDITFFGTVPSGNPLLSQYASTVSYDPQRGSFSGSEDIRQAGLGAKVLDSFETLHFGTFGGLTTRILWLLAGLAPLLLSVTGLYIWALRRDKRKRTKIRKALQAPGDGECGADSRAARYAD